MTIEFQEISDLSGPACHIYSVFINDDVDSVFEDFLAKHENTYPDETKNILDRLETIGHETGAIDTFFKKYEGSPGDCVDALFDEDKHLRLYCIRYKRTTIILGSGGIKPKGVRAYQEVQILKKNAELMKRISKLIDNAIKEGDVSIENDGTIKCDIILNDYATD